MPFGAARELAAYWQRAQEAWPRIQITDVDSYGLPDTPLLGSELTLTATVQLAGLGPTRWWCRRCVGRVDAGDALVDPVTVPMAHTGTADDGNEVFSTTTPLPVAGRSATRCGCCRTIGCWPRDNELGLVTLRESASSRSPSTAGRTRWRPGPTARCG